MVDFKGQLLAERVFQFITITATLVGFVYGWAVQSFEKTFECWAVGVVLATIACVPDWWFYRKNPIKWREPDYSVRAVPPSSSSSSSSFVGRRNFRGARTRGRNALPLCCVRCACLRLSCSP